MVFKSGGIPWNKGKKGVQKAWNKGIPMSDDQRKKISEKFKGKPLPENALKKCREANLGNNYHKGMKMSDSARQKISAAMKGRKFSEEHKKKIGLANKGKKRSPETCKLYSLVQIERDNRGERNPNWKGGLSFEPYCPKFNNEFKERVRAFFGYKCQICGHVWQPGEKRLSVHHVNYRKDACCNEITIPLFVPLCFKKCHIKTNTNREFWEDWFTEIINEFYGGKCYLPKTS